MHKEEYYTRESIAAAAAAMAVRAAGQPPRRRFPPGGGGPAGHRHAALLPEPGQPCFPAGGAGDRSHRPGARRGLRNGRRARSSSPATPTAPATPGRWPLVAGTADGRTTPWAASRPACRLPGHPGHRKEPSTTLSSIAGPRIAPAPEKAEQLLITGVTTHLCCESTARSAFVRGFAVFIAIDGTATLNRELHVASLRALALGFARPVLGAELLAAMAAPHDRPGRDHRRRPGRDRGRRPAPRAASEFLLFEKERIGGLLNEANSVENFPGVPRRGARPRRWRCAETSAARGRHRRSKERGVISPGLPGRRFAIETEEGNVLRPAT